MLFDSVIYRISLMHVILVCKVPILNMMSNINANTIPVVLDCGTIEVSEVTKNPGEDLSSEKANDNREGG
jgi:hypothetical protein